MCILSFNKDFNCFFFILFTPKKLVKIANSKELQHKTK